MTHRGIAQRLIRRYGAAYASGLAAGRMKRAIRRGNDIATYGWFRVGELITKIGTTEVWS